LLYDCWRISDHMCLLVLPTLCWLLTDCQNLKCTCGNAGWLQRLLPFRVLVDCICIWWTQWTRGPKRGSTVARLLGLQVRIPPGRGCLSLVSVMPCQLEVCATNRSFVQRSEPEWMSVIEETHGGSLRPLGLSKHEIEKEYFHLICFEINNVVKIYSWQLTGTIGTRNFCLSS